MATVNVTIDGVTGSVPAQSTVLEAARLVGVKIPTLCDHPAIKPIGACRICLVEVEKQRTLQPACVFPVSEGMVVHPMSPKCIEARRFVLQLLFSERNHFCMFCQMSGSCELQSLAYEYGLDHWLYDRGFPKLAVDASRDSFVMDHNRCILCRRCIRACDELVGNNTLGLKNRGASTMVIADMDVPFGDSSCVSCGTCLQVCPTGALLDRLSAYMGATKEVTRVKSRCNACSVGCGVELVVRDNRVIRVEGDWDAEPNHGLICQIGRFSLLSDKRERVVKPLIKTDGDWKEATWDQALAQVASGLKAAGDKIRTVVSGIASTETAQAMAKLPGEKYAMDGAATEASSPLAALDEADVFVVAQTDLTANYQVASFAIKRGIRHRGARLIVLDDQKNGLDSWAAYRWSPQDANKAIEIAKGAQSPAILFDPRGAALASKLAAVLPNAKLVRFAPGGNSLGLAANGISAGFAANGAPAYYVLAGETTQISETLLQALKKASFVVVQASFQQPWAGVADVILPSPTLFEKAGSIINTEGRVAQLAKAVETAQPGEAEIVQRLIALV